VNWRSIAAAATPDTLERLEEVLWDAGAISVTVEDGGENPLFEPGPAETPLWDEIVVTGLFEENVDPNDVKKALRSNDFSLLYVDELGDREWEREWLSRFKPMPFGKRLWVCPTGFDAPAPEAIVMHLDPGLAFGTGTHATTRLCLEWLDGHMDSDRTVADFGCGSGILGIAAILLGAARVLAVDHDPQALTATVANAERNGVEDRIRVCEPKHLPPGQYDVVLANILAQPLVELSGVLVSLLLPGGALVMSGITPTQADQVRAAYPGFDFEVHELEGWVLLHGVRR